MVSLPAVTAPKRGARAGADADGVLNLLWSEPQHAAGNDGRDECRQRGVMPAALANARESRLAQAHLELVAEHQADDQLAAIAPRALAGGDRSRKDVGGMRRILLPVNVVVIHAADHQRVGQRRRDRIHLLAAADHGRLARSGDLVQHLERDCYIVLLISAECTADAVQQKALGLIDRLGGKLLELQACCPL